jgi:hypothetical protein
MLQRIAMVVAVVVINKIVYSWRDFPVLWPHCHVTVYKQELCQVTAVQLALPALNLITGSNRYIIYWTFLFFAPNDL